MNETDFNSSRLRKQLFPARYWYQHRYSLTIFAVCVSVEIYQVPFFELDRDNDVSSCHDREEQMTESHAWRAPESDDEPKIERVPNHLIQGRRLEGYLWFGPALEIVVNLLESKQGKMINQVGRYQHNAPAHPEKSY